MGRRPWGQTQNMLEGFPRIPQEELEDVSVEKDLCHLAANATKT